MIHTKYRIIEGYINPLETQSHFWIEATTYLFKWKLWVRCIGDYEIDDTYGELGSMPFMDYISAQNRIVILKLRKGSYV